MFYADCYVAIRDGNAKGNTCIGWHETEKGWVLYDPTKGAPEGVKPEFLCVKSGCVPLPLSDDAWTIFRQMSNGRKARLLCDQLSDAMTKTEDGELRHLLHDVIGEMCELSTMVGLLRDQPDMNGAAIHQIRQMLADHGVPPAAYIDDAVANAIKQRDMLFGAVTQLQELVFSKWQPTDTAGDLEKAAWEARIKQILKDAGLEESPSSAA